MKVTLKEVYVEGDPQTDVVFQVNTFYIHHNEVVTEKFIASKSRWQWWTLYNTEGNTYAPEHGEPTFGKLIIEDDPS